MKLIKQYVGKTVTDDEERTVTATISTAAVDRDKDVLLPKGAEIENYMKNPVVMWAHQYGDTPIGKALYVDKKRKNITAKVQFPKEGDSSKADEVYRMFKGGFLNAFSVGFLPKKHHQPTPAEIKKTPEWAEAGRIYDEWELLEFSAVPVPANPEALAMAVKDLALDNDICKELGICEMIKEPVEEPKVEPVKVPINVSHIVETVPITVETIGLSVDPFYSYNKVDEMDSTVKRMTLKMKGKMYE